MIKIKCRCGKSEKTFKKDIGPFWLGTCCEASGYDHQGNKIGETEKAQSQPESKVEAESKVEVEVKVKSDDKSEMSESVKSLWTEDQLMNLSTKKLRVVAAEFSVSGIKRKTKKELTDAILNAQK